MPRGANKTPAKTSTPKPTNTASTAANTDSEKRRGGGRPRKNKENTQPSSSSPSAFIRPALAASTAQNVDQAASDDDPQALKEKIASLEARLAAAQKAPAPAAAPAEDLENIEPIPRPKGEAGNRKTGFVLKEAMRLHEGDENEVLYNKILRVTRRNITRVNLDVDALYRQQDAEKLANVFRLTRSKIPYLTRKRFPADWAIAEIVKQYLANQRKAMKKQKGHPAGKRRRAREDSNEDSSSGSDNDEDEDTQRRDKDEDGDEGEEEGENEGEDEETVVSKRRRVIGTT